MNALRESIEFLGGTALLLAAVAWLVKTLVDTRLKNEGQKWVNQDLETLRDRLQRNRDRDSQDVAAKQALEARIRGDILLWANPILGAVRDLESRLRNIVRRGAYPALQRNPVAPHSIPENWSIAYDYFMPSTLFVFAQYFYWVRRLREELGFALFESQADKDAFFAELWKVSDALGRWPLFEDRPCAGKDAQVFNLQQRGIGEAITVRGEVPRCMGFDEFMEAWEDPPLSDQLAPLRSLLEDLVADGSCRWQRMEVVLKAVQGLEAHCRQLLRLPPAPEAAGGAASVAKP